MRNSEKLKFILPAIWASFIISNSFFQPKLELRHGSDKLAHIILYLPMGFTLYNSLLPKYFGIRNLLLSALTGGLFLGSIDEFIQGYTPGRESSIGDILADTIGTLLGAIIKLRLPQKQKK